MKLASGQHGVLSRAQLLAEGIAADVVDRLLKSKRLRAAHRGVYLVGPVVAPRTREMAAVLACGETGVISHASAVMLWQLPPERESRGVTEVSAVQGNHLSRAGVRVHRARALHADEVTKLDGIPVTTAARTLYDVAATASSRALERIFAAALGRGLTNRDELLLVLARHPRQPGTSRLRALIESETQPAMTWSKAEERFLALMRKVRLPLPAVNTSIGPYRVDFLWREERFVVELDGFASHSSSEKFESDRLRDSELAAAGLRVARVTWRQLTREPEAVAVRVAQALAHARKP
jgi:very-short-patch-repair endonuclease